MPKLLAKPLPLVFAGQARPLQVVYSGWSSFEVRANPTKRAEVGFGARLHGWLLQRRSERRGLTPTDQRLLGT